MHELSIVMGIVDIAAEQVRRAGAAQVERIDLDIGELAGVEFDALDFAWRAGVRHTVLDRAERHINRIPGRGRCMDCDTEFDLPELYHPCPNCGGFLAEVIRGKELRVKSLTVEG